MPDHSRWVVAVAVSLLLLVAGTVSAARPVGAAAASASRANAGAAAFGLPPGKEMTIGRRPPPHRRDADAAAASVVALPSAALTLAIYILIAPPLASAYDQPMTTATSTTTAAPVIVAAPPPAADVARGSELFVANCAGCHAGGMNFVRESRTLKRDALEKFVGGADEESVRKFFSESSRHRMLVFPKMPGGKLQDGDVADVTSFVSEQAINDGW